MRRALMVAALAAALSVADRIRGGRQHRHRARPRLPRSDTYLTYFGCENLLPRDSQAPQVRIGRKDAALAGNRSFGLLVPGAGTASGPVHLTDSVADHHRAGFSARADEGGHRRRLRLVRHRRARRGTGLGRARRPERRLELDHRQHRAGERTPGSCWTPRPATWSTTAGPAASPTSPRAHGDGPGYMLAGFGCQGEDFSIDALRFGTRVP